MVAPVAIPAALAIGALLRELMSQGSGPHSDQVAQPQPQAQPVTTEQLPQSQMSPQETEAIAAQNWKANPYNLPADVMHEAAPNQQAPVSQHTSAQQAQLDDAALLTKAKEVTGQQPDTADSPVETSALMQLLLGAAGGAAGAGVAAKILPTTEGERPPVVSQPAVAVPEPAVEAPITATPTPATPAEATTPTFNKATAKPFVTNSGQTFYVDNGGLFDASGKYLGDASAKIPANMQGVLRTLGILKKGAR